MMNPADLLLARKGPMTSELVQHPADYGLGMLPASLHPARTVRSTCGYCSTGCSLLVHVDETGQAINLGANHDYPVNRGMACPKGWEALSPLKASDRATVPLLRNPLTGSLEPVSWQRALQEFVIRFKTVQKEHGAAALSFLSTGQIVTEEMALLGALGKFGMGMVHVDSNTRQCMATAHTAYRQSFGFDAPPFSYADFEESDVLVFVGANPCIAHPILWQRVMANRRSPAIIVVDPRMTETATAATHHLRINPKSDQYLLYALALLAIQRGALDRDFIAQHTNDFECFAAFLADFTVERASSETGLSVESIHAVADLVLASEKRVSFWWTMGVNQSHQATRTAQAIINLALMTGQIGKPGTGANSITGQCNAMGSRLFGNSSTLLGGYDFADSEHRKHVGGILGIDASLIPAEKSRAYDQILEDIDAGLIRGLWVVATNPAHSWIGQGQFHELRKKLDFLVVQDMYHSTEMAQMADLVLPAAGWGEKEGTFINSERRISVTRKVSKAPGQALSDFAIFKLVAEAWGCGDLFRSWATPEDVFQILKRLSYGTPADFSGIRDYAHLDEQGGIQWPYPDAARQVFGDEHVDPERRLFSDGLFFTPDRRARFFFDAPRPLPEPTSRDYPLLLNTGRGSSSQWHTGSRTSKSAVLRKLAPREQIVEINPVDAASLGISDAQPVRVVSVRGEARALAFVTQIISPGQVFMPMHFPEVNRLTFPAFDPHSRQPAYKACAVRVEP